MLEVHGGLIVLVRSLEVTPEAGDVSQQLEGPRCPPTSGAFAAAAAACWHDRSAVV
jgi:hypothetical protein